MPVPYEDTTLPGYGATAALDRGWNVFLFDGPGTPIPVVVIIYMLKFSKSYPERVTHTGASVPATT